MAIGIFLIALVVVILIALQRKDKHSSANQIHEKNQIYYNSLINSLNEPAKSAFVKLKDIYENNSALTWVELLQQLQIPIVTNPSDLNHIKTYLDIQNNESAQDFLFTCMLCISERERLEYKPLHTYTKTDALKQFKINIDTSEVLYQPIVSTEWYEDKIVSKDVRYSGLNISSGNLQMGKLNYAAETIKRYKLQDIGTVYITNKRIVFIGKYKNINRSVSIGQVLNYKPYQDGILLGLSDGKLPLIRFYEHDNTNVDDPNNAFIINDGMNKFVRIVSRLLSNSADLDLRPNDN